MKRGKKLLALIKNKTSLNEDLSEKLIPNTNHK